MKRFLIIATVILLAACTNGGGTVTTDQTPGPDSVSGDAELDLAGPDTAPDTTPDTPEDTAPDCDKLCEAVECGLVGPSDECDCGTCDAGYDCSDEGTCLADCEALCDGTECGPAGADDECDCGTCDDENPCTDNACLIDGVCSFTPVADGGDCDDGDPCTLDGCQAGVCVGALKDCDDENYCTDDSCDPDTGDCVNPPNALFCDDEDPCTVDDVCGEGVCAGTAIDCACAVDGDCADLEDGDLCNGTLYCDTDFLPWTCAVAEDTIIECPDPEDGPNATCLVATCDPETGDCGFAPDNEGQACKDDDACTVGDTCTAGACVPGPGANCNDGDVCTDDACDPAMGCTHLFNTAPCDDGDPCTDGDVCADGTCTGVGTTDCDDLNPCTDDTCDALLGCQHVNNTAACDDMNACTDGDTCAAGSCVPGAAISCDDGDLCTDDGCDPLTGCTHADNTAPCDDLDACTAGDVCADGTCGGAAVTCDDANPCTDDSCDPTSGCVFTADNDNDCDDGNECTLGDHCLAGFCTPDALDSCDDDNPCTDDTCDPTDGCANVVDDQNTCDDKNPCTEGDYCANGFCGFTDLTDCDDQNPCTDDSCDPASGCVHQPNTLACDDGNECTAGDSCVDGACTAGGVVNCDDGNLCTTDSCDTAQGCVNANNTVPCNDNDVCTLVDACSGGACVGTGAMNCNDANHCTDDSCDPQGGCQHGNNTIACDDNNTCTTNDVCLNGVCSGTGDLDCDDDNPCTMDLCLPEGGCGHEDLVDEPCNDDDPCTANDYCEDGACVSGGAVDCNDQNPCTDDACDPQTGACINTPNTAPCTDGNACTIGDQCAGGSCGYAGLEDCDDDNVCTTDSCDPLAGCLNGFNDIPCVDGNACTTNDHCQEGICLGGSALTCDDGNPCTDDACYASSGCAHIDDDSNPCDDGNECTVNACMDGTCVTTQILVCGGNCGVCTGPQEDCVDGACVCQAACDGLECGPDGCGDVCGTCGDDQACDDGLCEQGDDCTAPWIVDGIPFSFDGDTAGAENEYSFGAGACEGVNSARGAGSDDEVFSFTPEVTGVYTITLDADFDSVLYVATDCTDVDGTCLGAKDLTTIGEEVVIMPLTAGETYAIFVDGWSMGDNLTGAYSLTILDPCIPDCAGKVCGDDGCGFTCGDCPEGETCSDGACIPVDGDTCAAADEILELDVAYAGDTTDAADNYGIPGGSSCPGGPTWAVGVGSPDQAWVFTPAASGRYRILYDHDTDGAIYVVTDCDDLEGSCVGIADEITGDEELLVDLTANTTYYIITDGYQAQHFGPYELTVSLVGDTCDDPISVDAVPFTFGGDTTPMTNDHAFLAGSCEGETSSRGAGSMDMVFDFVPEVSGIYTITVDPDFDSLLYVVSDCMDVDGTCMGASDAFVTEELVLSLTAGLSYTIIVDGWSDTSDISGAFTLTIDEPCIPDCAGKVCGGDGCGGTCAPGCAVDQVCTPAGTCTAPSAGDSCAAAFDVDAVPFSYAGDTSLATDLYAYGATDCPGETFPSGTNSPDQAFLFNPAVSGIYTITLAPEFDSALYIVTDCAEISTSCLKADETWGTEEIVIGLDAGTDYYIIVDGYGTNGYSGAYTLTISAACLPDCDDKECGSDGCDGSCGECGPGMLCTEDGLCELVAGDDCDTPIPVDGLPYSYDGTTEGALNDYSFAADACPGMPAMSGDGSSDQAFEFIPAVSGVYTISLAPDFDALLAVVTDCDATDTSCLAGSDTSSDEEIILALDANQAYYIIVDGYSNSANTAGAYSLSVSAPCIPDCDGKECGDDGCGLTCGQCQAGDQCDPDGLCQLLPGDICSQAFVVDAIPYSDTGDTTGFGLDYGFAAGSCIPETGTRGMASSDAAYEFTPAQDGAYTLTVDADFDSVLYVVTDCDDVDGTCAGAVDDNWSTGVESIELVLTADTTYYIIVDGWSNNDNVAGAYTLTLDILGDTCADAMVIDGFPATITGSTAGWEDDYSYGSGDCPPETGGWGVTAPDRVWAFTPMITGDYEITLADVGNWGTTVYVVEDCADITNTCLAGDEQFSAPELVTATLTAGTTYYIIVDGWGGSASGDFVLTLDLPGYISGDTCDDAFVVDGVPYAATGDTSDASPDYGYTAGSCPGETSAWGAGANDEVYEFTPDATSDYIITLDADFDSNLYVITDCDDVDGSCLAANETMGIETVTLTLTAGLTYYIIVDGYGTTNNQDGPYSLTIAAVTPPTPLAINEVDYDQIGTDSGEFIELYNGSSAPFSLVGVTVELINGNDGLAYNTLDLSTVASALPADNYLVIGTATVVAALPPGTLSMTFAAASNNIQNGGPDGLQVLVDGVQIDGLSYEGTIDGVGEGTAGPADSNTVVGSLSRCPNGADTDDNGVDFVFSTTPTPGLTNTCP